MLGWTISPAELDGAVTRLAQARSSSITDLSRAHGLHIEFRNRCADSWKATQVRRRN